MTSSSNENLNLVQIFLECSKKYAQKKALYYFLEDQLTAIDWNEWRKQVFKTATFLKNQNIQKESKVAILSENRPEWTYVDFGTLSLGAALVPIYPTSSYQDVLYILKNATVEVLFVSCKEHYDRLKGLLNEDIPLKQIIVFDSLDNLDPSVNVLCFGEALKVIEYKEELLARFEEEVSLIDPETIATIIYTSGTTGPPKGVMLSHRNFVANYISASKVIHINENDRSLSFLPLSHVFERLAGYYFMAFHGAEIAYARSMQTVSEDMLELKPTVAAAVPRFYEKVYAKILEKIDNAPKIRQKIFYWAVNIGCEVTRIKTSGKTLSFFLKIKYAIAHKLVFSKLKEKLGGRIRFFISGGAPLAKELAEFFYAADVLILEGYGLTETSPVIAVNTPENPQFGVVGKPLDVAEVKIAEDGEILTRGDCVMKGYYQNPQATSEVIDQDNWFHTGDIGEITAEGFLKITDRKKDIIVTSGGKNIAPQNLENKILMDTLFTQLVVIGDKRNYLVALIVPNRAELEKFAEEKRLQDVPYSDLLKRKETYEFVEMRLREVMDDMPSYEQIKYFSLMEKEFCQEEGELTPTMKVKRKVIVEKYANIIEELYERGESFNKV